MSQASERPDNEGYQIVSKPKPTPVAEHELKCERPFFGDVFHGSKTAELRRFDRPFRVGDRIRLREYLPDCAHYTGSEVLVEVTHILTDADGPWLAEGFCMLSFKVSDDDLSKRIKAEVENRMQRETT